MDSISYRASSFIEIKAFLNSMKSVNISEINMETHYLSKTGNIILDTFQENGFFSVARVRTIDSGIVLVKYPQKTLPFRTARKKLMHENRILKLIVANSTVKVIAYEESQDSVCLAMEDHASILIDAFFKKIDANIKKEISIFIGIVKAISDIHNLRIIHNALQPANILIDEKSGQIKIANFENASLVPYLKRHLSSKEFRESSGLYTSPEQTGMTNRSIDHRSDFYALGTVFYEILCGRLPYSNTNPLGILHAIVHDIPESPHAVNPDIPPELSATVMKLLEKKAEDRYQSCTGIIHDLELCAKALDNRENINTFIPGEKDLGSMFYVPEKLYGRNSQINILASAYVKAGMLNEKPILAFVSGPPGIGKSSLIQEFRKSVAEQKGYFISGKYDQFRRSAPYSAVISAFRNLVDLLITDTDAPHGVWGERIRESLGDNTSIITEIIPCLERITGPIPPVAPLSPSETEIRFSYVFQKFISLFANENAPLVLALEDLQWADGPSIDWLRSILRNPELTNFMFIGSFREDEIGESHQFEQFFDSLTDESGMLHIRLGPLRLEDIDELISDTLHTVREGTKSLAEIVISKTGGNAFFVNEYVKALSHGKLFGNFVTDNVIEFIAGKIRTLPKETQELLRIASCAGIIIFMDTFSIVVKKDADEIIEILKPAIDEGLVIKLESDLMFSHDRIRKAIYGTIEEGEKEKNHYDLGMALLSTTGENEIEDRIFPIVHQLNMAKRLIKEPAERIELATLNLRAGLKSKNSIAYDPALVFFYTANDLLPADAWISQFDLKLSLLIETCEVEYLTGNLDKAESSFHEVIDNARDRLDKARVYKAQIPLNTMIGRPGFALAQGRKACSLLGMKFPGRVSQAHIMSELVKALLFLKLRKLESCSNLQAMTDPVLLSTAELFMNITLPAYISSPDTVPYLIIKLFNFSVNRGNSPYSGYAYAGLGVILANVLGDITTGYALGKFAFELGAKIDSRLVRCKVNFLFGNLINHWKRPLREDIPILDEGMIKGFENGDITFASFCANHSLAHSIFCAESLDSVKAKGKRLLDTMRRFREIESIRAFFIFYQCAINLSDASPGKCFSIDGEFFREKATFEEWTSARNLTDLGFYSVLKQMLTYLAGDFESCIGISEDGKKYLGSILGMPYVREHYYYHTLALIAKHLRNGEYIKKKTMKIIEGNLGKIRKWAAHCPENSLHKQLFIEAELSALNPAVENTLTAYDKAIDTARRNGFVNECALISERAANFCYGKRMKRKGDAFMINAFDDYAAWGARGKCEVIKLKFPELFHDRG
jgi:predicted ATPase